MVTYQEENNAMLKAYLDRTFYHAWKNPADLSTVNYQGLEIIFNYTCNLNCSYCYVSRYGDQLYPPELYEDEEALLHNLDIILDWLVENNYSPRLEFFSGEPFVQRSVFRALNKILDRMGNGKTNTKTVLIPTNYTFILSESLTKQVENIIQKGKDVGIYVSLSASIDGKYCDANRPFRYNIAKSEFEKNRIWKWEYNDIPDKRDDAYYDKCFAFAKKYEFGFHPMIYSQNIEKWKDNFLWFQSMFKKFDIPWNNIYLLEVRNPEWTPEKTIEFGKFIEFLIEWTYKQCGDDFERYINFVVRGKGFNILASPIIKIGRGIGCSIQSMIYLRLGDLKIVPCHRTSYDQFGYGKLKVVDDKIVDVEAISPELLIGINATNANNYPYCEQCGISESCSHGCLGAQHETTGDFFTPFPTMCRMEHEKIRAMIRAYKKLGIYDQFIRRIMPDKAEAFKYMEELMNRGDST